MADRLSCPNCNHVALSDEFLTVEGADLQCLDCGWEGGEDEVETLYRADGSERWGCPECGGTCTGAD